MKKEEKIITKLINFSTYEEALCYYILNKEVLKDYTVIFFDDRYCQEINGNTETFLLQSKRIKFVSTFQEKPCFLNEEIASEMLKGEVCIRYKPCFNLDVNIMNELEELHNSQKDNELLQEFENLKLNLVESDISCNPYIFENAGKLEDNKVRERVKDILLLFNKFKRTKKMIEFSPEYPFINQDYESTKETMDMMEKSYKNEILYVQQKHIYLILLKTALIALTSKKGIKNKITELFEFINLELGYLYERELVISYFFLKDREDEKIRKLFKKVQKSAKDIVGVLRGIAWDLFHLRCLEMNISTDLRDGFFSNHYLITCDKGLQEVTNVHPVKVIIHEKGALMPRVIFGESLVDIITEIDILKEVFEKSSIRTETRKKLNVDNLIKKYETEILKIL